VQYVGHLSLDVSPVMPQRCIGVISSVLYPWLKSQVDGIVRLASNF